MLTSFPNPHTLPPLQWCTASHLCTDCSTAWCRHTTAASTASTHLQFPSQKCMPLYVLCQHRRPSVCVCAVCVCDCTSRECRFGLVFRVKFHDYAINLVKFKFVSWPCNKWISQFPSPEHKQQASVWHRVRTILSHSLVASACAAAAAAVIATASIKQLLLSATGCDWFGSDFRFPFQSQFANFALGKFFGWRQFQRVYVRCDAVHAHAFWIPLIAVRLVWCLANRQKTAVYENWIRASRLIDITVISGHNTNRTQTSGFRFSETNSFNSIY